MVQFDEQKSIDKIKELRKKEAEEFARTLSDKHGVGYADLTRASIDPDALRLIPEKEAKNLNMAVFGINNKKIRVALLSPNKEGVEEKISELEERGFVPEIFMVSKRSLEKAWNRYKELSFATETKSGILEISNEDIENDIEGVKTIDDARKLIQEILNLKKGFKISRIVETILASALAVNASDVHIEPEESYVRLRFRLNGILTDIMNFDIQTYELLRSRLKLLSGLKLNVKKEAQDGRFSITINDTDIEIRTSALPGAYGESIVMRLLDPKNIRVPMEDLGMDERLLKIVKREIERPNGMILTTGPTGSGKTTTLYAFLNKVYSSDIKIITIEDPVEYHLPGITQTQVDKREEYNFSTGLRSALRQDPDVIMVGEIRDEDTAKIAINASLTGHLVFSTLHTNSASGTFARLIDLGVDPKSLGPAINIALAQRLVRKLNPKYKKKVPLEGQNKKIVEGVLSQMKDKSKIKQSDFVWEPETKEGKSESGYIGRIGLFEGILVDDEMEALVVKNPRKTEIEELAKTQGLQTIVEDGITKALNGMTSMEELKRVLDFDNYL